MSNYPYISSAGPLVKTVERFRKQFPADVTADTLKKLGIAPKNESYVINILRFLGLIDSDGKKTEVAKAFLQHDDAKFASEFALMVRAAYSPIFDLFGEDDAWAQDRDELVSFFRTSDSSSDVVGKRQATTFTALAALSGHGELAPQRTASASPKKTSVPAKAKVASSPADVVKAAVLEKPANPQSNVGLTVRIEVNLPANGDQKTYDAIFQSIRKNLIDSE